MALKILVAEDDRHTRRILDHIFTKDPAFRDQDVTLHLAPDGEEAARAIADEYRSARKPLPGFGLGISINAAALERLARDSRQISDKLTKLLVRDVMTPAPGAIRGIVPITLPRPRDETSTEMGTIIRNLREMLRGVKKPLATLRKSRCSGGSISMIVRI